MIKFVFGAPGSGKTHYVFDRLAEDFENSVLIVPEQQTVSCERRALELLPAASQLSFEVLNFSRLCNRVFRLFGGLSYHYINDGMRSLFMWRTLRELAPLLEQYRINGNEASLTPIMLSAAAEMKSCRVSSDALEDAAEKLADKPTLRGKLRDLALIGTSYDNLIKQSFDDTSDDLFKLCDILDKESFFKGKKVYIDSFTSFTAPETRVLKRIFAQADEVTVTLGCESPTSTLICNSSITETYKKLEELAENAKCKTENVFLTVNHRTERPELREICSSIWEPGAVTAAPEITENDRGAVRITSCKNAHAEADMAVAAVLREVAGGMRYRDIAIIARDLSSRNGIIDAALEASGIPHFMSRESDLAAKPVIRLLTTALRIKIYGFSADDVIANLNTGLYPIDRRDADLFCDYVNTWSITGNAFREDGWSMNPDGYTDRISPRGHEILAAANRARTVLIGTLERFFTRLSSADDVRGMCAAIYAYFEDIGLADRLRGIASEHLARGNRRDATDTLGVYNLMMNILDDTVTALGDEKLTCEELMQALLLEVRASKIGSIPTGYDEVTVGSASLLRADGIKCAIVLGLNDDEFPRAIADDGIFSESERNALIPFDISMFSSVEERTREEFLFARRALSAASDKLYLLYCTHNSSGKLLNPSMLVKRIRSRLPYLKEEDASKLPLTETLCSPALAASRISEIAHTEEGQVLERLLVDRGSIAVDRRVSIPECAIDPQTADEVFGSRIALSQSKIDKYVLCKFRYYCENVLSLREDEKARVGSDIAGTFVHALLENFLKTAVEQNRLDLAFEETEMISVADGIIGGLIDEICPPSAKSSGHMSHLFLRLRRLALIMLRNLKEEFAHSSFKPEFFELALGMGHGIESPKFKLEDGTVITLDGKIDRVDVMRRDGEVYLRVIDYKTGSKQFSMSDIKEGLNLQLLIYIFALCRKDTDFARELGCPEGHAPIPAASHYLAATVSPQTVDKPQSEEVTLKNAVSSLSRTGLYLNDPDILTALNSDFDKNMLGGIAYDKNGDLKGNGLVSPEDFKELSRELENTVMRIASEMKSGIATAAPHAGSGKSPCEYCSVRSVCRSAN